MKKLLKIKLNSASCFGGGSIFGSIVDTEIVTDEYGIPCISGKRIKGLFHEMALELMEFGMTDQTMIDKIFGKTGNSKEEIHFPTLYPVDYEKFTAFLDKAKDNDNWKMYASRDMVLNVFTEVRSQTALDDTGIAKENSLRVLRAAKKDILFQGIINCPESISTEEIKLLENCASMIRHMGLNRTRGMGCVYCELIDDTSVNTDKTNSLDNCNKVHNLIDTYKSDSLPEMQEEVLPVRIYLKQPCVIETDYIPGSILRGMYAAAYMKYSKSTEVHDEDLFRDLFMGSNVKYGYCWPIQHISSTTEKIYYSAPNSFVQVKKANDSMLYDLAGYEDDELVEVMDDKERCKLGLVSIGSVDDDSANVYSTTVNRIETYHHRRPEDRSYGHALKSKNKTKVSDGQLYTKEAIAKGQEFYGEIRGPKGLLDVLKMLIVTGHDAYIGSSRTAEYGNIRISYEKIKETITPMDVYDQTVITLISPMVVRDEYGNDSTDAKDVLYEILGDRLEGDETIKSYCKEELVEGYNAKWNMPVTQRNVLQAGSVFVIYGMELEEDDIEELNAKSYGLYQNEGYGRILVNWHGEVAELESDEYPRMKEFGFPAYDTCKGTGYQIYVDACLEDMVRKMCLDDKDSASICYKLRKQLQKVPNTHVLSGLQQISKTSIDFTQFGTQIKKATKRATEKNTEWFDQIYKLLSEKDALTNESCSFLGQGMGKVDSSRLPSDYRQKMKELLKCNSYNYFREKLLTMIYEVRLDKDKRGN